jgi:inner membrane transporter RhtA
MLALLPATATAIGVLVLGQVPTAAELVGVALVIAAVALHRARDVAPYRAARRRTQDSG